MKKFALIYTSYYVESGVYTEILAIRDEYDEIIKVLNETISTDEKDNNIVGKVKKRNDYAWEYVDEFTNTIISYKIEDITKLLV